MCNSAHTTVRFLFSLLYSLQSTPGDLTPVFKEHHLVSLCFTPVLILQQLKLLIISSSSLSQAKCTCFLNKATACTYYYSPWANAALWVSALLLRASSVTGRDYPGTTRAHHSWHLMNNLNFERRLQPFILVFCLRSTPPWQRSRTPIQ